MHSEHHPAPAFQGFRPAALPPAIGMHTPASAASHPHHGTCSDLLPPLLQDFERLIGLQPTMTLVQRWGGLRIYIPTPDKVTAEHPYAADRKSTRLNSSHLVISYAVFCLKKKKAARRSVCTLHPP